MQPSTTEPIGYRPRSAAVRVIAQLVFYVVTTAGAYAALNLLLLLAAPFIRGWPIAVATARPRAS